ncbi:hypothetical protein ACOMHN_028541 [Nucella lapillus]
MEKQKLCILVCLFWSASQPSVRRLPLASAQALVGRISDKYGNYADNESNLFFVNYNGTANYEIQSDVPLQDDGLMPFYDFARSVSSTTFGSDYPYGQ